MYQSMDCSSLLRYSTNPDPSPNPSPIPDPVVVHLVRGNRVSNGIRSGRDEG